MKGCDTDSCYFLLTVDTSSNITIAIIGGIVVAVVVILAVTVIVIVFLFLWHRNRQAKLLIQRDIG